MRPGARGAALALALLLVGGCDPAPPLRIGYLAGLSGRTIATGQDGRNGAMLAVEQRNAAGGAQGRRLELLVQDNGPTAESARAAMQALLDAKADAVVGPFASSTALAVLPMADQARVLLVSPSATASVLAGQDDQLLMMSTSTRDATRAYADWLWQRGRRRLALATSVEPRNAVFYTSWRDEFSAAFRARGGEILPGADFLSDENLVFGEIVATVLSGRPDGLVLVCQVVDVARLVQQVRRQAPDLTLVAADGAATEALIRLGGRAVEGMLVGQPRDAGSTAPAYTAFLRAFQDRFGQAPGYPAVIAYDAVQLLADAQSRRRDGESLKDAVLRHGPYAGLQQPIAFDAHGDVQHGLHFAAVRDGRFQVLP